MPDPGLSDTGFTAKTEADIQTSIEDAEKSAIDAGLDVTAAQPLGQINQIEASSGADLWSLMATMAAARNPKNATGFMLDNICAITGTKRLRAKRSTVTMTCTIGSGFTGAAIGGVVVNVAGQPSLTFRNATVLGALAAGTYSLPFECTTFGPVFAAGGTITVITQPVSGLTSVTNAHDTVIGRLLESDDDLRVRREEELSAPGGCTVPAIKADMLEVDGILQCFVYENVQLTTDENGLPGKSIEVVIFDGDVPAASTDAIAATVWKDKPAGAMTVGATSATVRDSRGLPQTVYFSRATVEPVWLEFDVVADMNFFPADGVDQIKDAVALFAQRRLNLGYDVNSSMVGSPIFSVPGVLEVTAIRLGFAPSPTGTADLPIDDRSIASIDTSRLVINVTPGTP